jgi:hypothetical protein
MSNEREDAVRMTSQLVYHPSIFNFVDTAYISKSIKNLGISFNKHQVYCCDDNLNQYNEISKMILQNPEFFVFVIFKLLERNIFISAHNIVCVSENENSRPVHCDLIACNPKKKEIYIIVFCNDRKRIVQCHLHSNLIIEQLEGICPVDCKVVPMVLSIYDFKEKSTMRLCKKTRR